MKDVRIPVRDGKSLAADIYLPEGEGPWPAVLVQTPYSKRLLGAALPHPSAKSWLDFWDRKKYALVISDWRGFHASKDAGEGMTPKHRGRDGFDLIEWIANQVWCDRKIAGWGPSALGRALFRAAVERPPHLVCGVPLVCHMGHFYEDFHEGGVLERAHVEAIRALGFGMTPEILEEPYSGSEFYRDGARESRPHLLNVPLFFISGWYDLNVRQTLRFFADVRARGGPRARAYSKLLVGPWHHTAIDHDRQGQLHYPEATGEAAKATDCFLDCWIRGDPSNGWHERDPVVYWQMGEDRWRAAPTWPPPGIGNRVLHLGADGTIDDAPAAEAGALSFVDDPADPVPTLGGANLPLGMRAGPYDQRPIEAREDVLVFSTAPLPDRLVVCGDVRVVLTVSVDRPDADVAVRLTDVDPDGRSMLVADSIQRLKLRESTTRPAPFTPGEPVRAQVVLPPTAMTFLPGHRLRLVVSGSNHPRYEQNTHTGADRFDPDAAVPARVTLHFGPDASADLHLPLRLPTGA